MGRLRFSQPVTSAGARAHVCVCACVAAVSSEGDVSLCMRLCTGRLVGKLKAITSDIGRGHSGYHVHTYHVLWCSSSGTVGHTAGDPGAEACW